MNPGHCFHCGEELPEKKSFNYSEEDNIEKKFCCSGCVNAYVFIKGKGFENYYEHREKSAPKPKEISFETEAELIEQKIAEDEKGIKKSVFFLEGIHCASCVWLNEKVLKQLDGMKEAVIHLSTGRAYLAWDSKKIKFIKIAETVAAMGYRLTFIDKSSEDILKKSSDKLLMQMVVAGFFTLNIMLISIALYSGYFSGMDRYTKNYFHLFSFILTVPVFIYSGSVFFKSAWHSIKNRILGMDILTSAGISLAFFYSCYAFLAEKGEVYFDSVCFVVFIILTGRYIESRLKMKNFLHIENLRASAPAAVETAEKKRRIIPVEEIKKNQKIIIKNGIQVPVDGILLDKTAELNESAVTGESRPVLKKRDSIIISGSVPVGREIKIIAQSTFKSSSLQQIIKICEESMNQVPAYVSTAAKAGRFFTGFVLVAGIFTFWFNYSSSLEKAVLSTIAFLIAACPCALNLAIPTVFTASVQTALKNGVMLKNGSILGILAKARYLILDKTGTLTEGKLKIVSVKRFSGSISKARNIARQMQEEAIVRHPVADAFLKMPAGNEKRKKFEKIKYITGRGIYAKRKETEYYLGSKIFLSEKKFNIAGNDEPGKMNIYLAEKNTKEKKITAKFVLEDTMKEDAAEILESLKEYSEPVILTGDTRANAEAASENLHIKTFFAEKNPREKNEILKSYKTKGTVCMVGDGINDAMALAEADCGISFAGASDVSLYSADILLLNNKLDRILFLFKLARKTKSKIYQNLFLAFLYNFLLLPLAFSGYIIPLNAAIFMSLSSITVILNSLLVFKTRA